MAVVGGAATVGGVRIGLNLSTSAAPGSDPVADATRAEALGFDFVAVSDHLHGRRPVFETWTLLAWVAAATERLDVVTDVLGLPYRPPAVLAKMAESLDRLSGGRLVLGVGAGGLDDEFVAFGLPRRTPKEKVDGLEDTLRILRGLWSEPTFTWRGEQHHVAAAELEPKPLRPIPVWVGGFGPRSLRIIGRLADGWLPSLPVVPRNELATKRDAIRAAADAAGRDLTGFAWACNVAVALGERRDDDRLVSGSPDEVAAQLRALVDELGLTVLNLDVVGEDPEAVEALAAEVVPHLR